MFILSLTFLVYSGVTACALAIRADKADNKTHKIFSLLACAQRTR
jgi:hypothetical protein